MDEQKMRDIMSDEAFVKELVELDTPEEVQARLKEKGVELSIEEIEQVAKALQSQTEGELSEDDLEDVAGGFLPLIIGIAALVTAGGATMVDFTMRARRRRW